MSSQLMVISVSSFDKTGRKAEQGREGGDEETT